MNQNPSVKYIHNKNESLASHLLFLFLGGFGNSFRTVFGQSRLIFGQFWVVFGQKITDRTAKLVIVNRWYFKVYLCWGVNTPLVKEFCICFNVFIINLVVLLRRLLRDTNLTLKGDERLFVVNMYFSLLVHYKLLVNWERVMFFKICGNKICDFSFCDSVCLNFIIFYE